MWRSLRGVASRIEKRFNAQVQRGTAAGDEVHSTGLRLRSGQWRDVLSRRCRLFMVRVRQDLNTQIDKILLSGTVASDIAAAGSVLTASMRPYIRILAPDGTVLYAGDLLSA